MKMAFALGMCSIALFAASKRDWQVGKVLDSRSAKTYMVEGQTTTTTGSATVNAYGDSARVYGSSNSQTTIQHMAIAETQIMIVGSVYAYVVDDGVEKAVGPPLRGSLARAIANRKHGCRYVVNDSIQYFQERTSLYVLDADGKECKLDIVRQERLQ